MSVRRLRATECNGRQRKAKGALFLLLPSAALCGLLLPSVAVRAAAQGFPTGGFRPQPTPGAPAAPPPPPKAPTPTAPPEASTAPVSVVSLVGNAPEIPIEQGPWVLDRVVLSLHGRIVDNPAWRDLVRGEKGVLYSKSDILYDVDALMGTGQFAAVTPSLYEMPGTRVPKDFYGIVSSTSEVLLVYRLIPQGGTAAAAQAATTSGPPKPLSVSGLIMTPTAWRGTGYYTAPGLSLDINAVYMIGRLYGKNSFKNVTTHTNYLDQVGVWLLTADGKMQVASEDRYTPAAAFGVQATALLRDTPQPQAGATTGTSFAVSANPSSQFLTDYYGVLSKKIGPVRASAGLMEGDFGDAVSQFSEFLSPQNLPFEGITSPGAVVKSNTMPFANIFFTPKPEHQLGIEAMRFNGALLDPWLINLKAGYFLKLDFNIGYLHFTGGYDVLGLIQFRYTLFPRLGG